MIRLEKARLALADDRHCGRFVERREGGRYSNAFQNFWRDPLV